MKKTLKQIGICLGIVLLAMGAYLVYAWMRYDRIEDDQKLPIVQKARNSDVKMAQTYRISTANLGFGAYNKDFPFFIAGENDSRVLSKDAVYKNMYGSLKEVQSLHPDFSLF